MEFRNYVRIEEHESVLEQLDATQAENFELKKKIRDLEMIVFELQNPSHKMPFAVPKSESSWYKPPVSPRLSMSRGRSGSVQGRTTFISRGSKNFGFLSVDSLTQEIKKAYELKDKTYDELISNKNSPAKADRLRSILERWEIEISALEEKKRELLSKY